MPWVVLQFVIVVFPDHTHFLCPSKFAVILMKKRERAGCFTLMSSWCLLTFIVLWHFPALPRVGRQCVIVVFPDHTHLLFYYNKLQREMLSGSAWNNLNNNILFDLNTYFITY